ncbi:hypothetical protein AB1L42_23565 [Thalassoglobus sp. JC818]|uniref:hypothetical protein n=1 Tax=Thalassoglobus sp. JC818 TaxID=3232136 RepID=UPI003458AFE5
MNCDEDHSIPDWILEHPETMRVFETLGFDVTCGGRSLGYVAQQHGQRIEDVLRMLEAAISE